MMTAINRLIDRLMFRIRSCFTNRKSTRKTELYHLTARACIFLFANSRRQVWATSPPVKYVAQKTSGSIIGDNSGGVCLASTPKSRQLTAYQVLFLSAFAGFGRSRGGSSRLYVFCCREKHSMEIKKLKWKMKISCKEIEDERLA